MTRPASDSTILKRTSCAYLFDHPDNMPVVEEGTLILLEGTIGGRAFISGQPVFVNYSVVERAKAVFDNRLIEAGIRSGGCVPLMARGRKLGVLGVGSFREDAFPEADQELLVHVANQIAIAVENALAYREIEMLKNKLNEEKLYLEEEINTAYNREHILRVLNETDWVVGGPNGAAAQLEMKRTTQQARMKKLGISRR